MARDLEVVFDYKPEEEAAYIDTLHEHGVVLLRGFLNSVRTNWLAQEVMAGQFESVDKWHKQGTIHEQYEVQEWTDARMAPPHTREFGDRLGEMMQSQGVDWLATAIRAQLYTEGEAGIDWHRDPEYVEQLVAALTASGSAQIDVKFARHELSVVTRPGDLFVVRNKGLIPEVDNRTEHRVHAPRKAKEGQPKNQRLSVAYRKEGQQAA